MTDWIMKFYILGFGFVHHKGETAFLKYLCMSHIISLHSVAIYIGLNRYVLSLNRCGLSHEVKRLQITDVNWIEYKNTSLKNI